LRVDQPAKEPIVLRFTWLVVVLGTVAAGTITALALFRPQLLQPGEIARPTGQLTPVDVVAWETAQLAAQNSARDGGLRIAAAVGALAGALLAWGRMELSRDERAVERAARDLDRVAHFSARYTSAVEQLGSGVHVQLGAIYALERLAIESDHHRQVVAEVLCAFVRGDGGTEPSTARASEPAVQAAMKVLERNRPLWERISYDLVGASLSGARLMNARLANAMLSGANLSEAHLGGADLGAAELTAADLSGAHMTGACLRDARLTETLLIGTGLMDADLTAARLSGAKLNYALMAGAKVTRADLTDADLTDADLTDADLTGADLTRAELTRADLSGAHLDGADLTGIHYGPNTVWPMGYEPPPSAPPPAVTVIGRLLTGRDAEGRRCVGSARDFDGPSPGPGRHESSSQVDRSSAGNNPRASYGHGT